MKWKDFTLRLRALADRRQIEEDLEDELSSHIELQTRKNLLNGMEAAEARRQALIQFGGVQRVTEECRDARGVNWITTPFSDALYALRGFRRSPLFVITAVATIALGLGIDTALFTIFNAYYFAPVKVRDPYSLYAIGRTGAGRGTWSDRAGGAGYSWADCQEFLTQNPAFSEAFGYRGADVRMSGRRAFGLLVTGDYFRVLGGKPALGRTLLAGDASSRRGEPVLVLSFSAWQNRLGADPNIVGKSILLHGYPFQVVGVAQSGFRGLGARPVDFWAPLTTEAGFDRGQDVFGPLSIVARLRPEYAVSQAQASVTLWARRLASDGPDAGKAVQGLVTSVARFKPWNSSNTLTFAPILVAFSLVLLLGCANVAGMMLARAMSRQREIGIRLSLGASRTRLICQMLAESTMLAFPAAAVGFALSQAMIWLCIRVLFATLPPGIADFASRLPALSPDIRVFTYNLAVALVAVLLCGLVPAVQATRTNLVQAAQGEFSGAFRTSRLRNALVAGQVAVCVLLLITTGILLRGVKQAEHLDGALSARDTIEISVQEKFRIRALDRLSQEPSVEILAAAAASPVGRKPFVSAAAGDGGPSVQLAANSVSPEYFTVFDLPVVTGRNFTEEEARSGAPVVIVSQTTARRLWPNQNAVGQSLRVVLNRTSAARIQGSPSVRVIGVSRDDISRWIFSGEERTLIYFPSSARAEGNSFFVAVRGDVETARRKLDSDLAAIDPNAADEIHRFQVRDFVAEEAFSFRLAYWGAAVIGGLALLLTLTGIYGVVAFAVSQRTKEIGIRMALGATTAAVTSLILKQSMRLASLGTLVGTVLALGMSKALASMILMIDTFDGLTYIAAILFVLFASAAAGYLPSRRAVGHASACQLLANGMQ
jgi:predicted permease